MREFTTIETFDITGRGTAHVIHVDGAAPERHEVVRLDGIVCEVVGVEHPIRRGMTAILVQPADLT